MHAGGVRVKPNRMHTDAGQRASFAGPLCHPLPLAAVLALVVNDHVLKGSGLLPAAVTGKLSDVAGLFFFPVLCASLVRALRGLAGRCDGDGMVRALGSIAITGSVFAALKLSPSFNAVAGRLWGHNTLDPTDLLALPSLGLAWLWLRHGRPVPTGDGLKVAAVVATGLASVATSRLHAQRVYPQWTADSAARQSLACATGEAWVGKSGKEGMGVPLELRTGEPRCAVEVTGAELQLPSRVVAAAALPGRMELRPGDIERVWLAFPFDGDAAWNAGERRATLRLAFIAGNEPRSWDIELSNAIEGGEQIRVGERDRDRGGDR